MVQFKTLCCYNCKSPILTLSETEMEKFSGLNFQCECCGHENTLVHSQFSKSSNNDPSLHIFSYERVTNP